MLHRTENRQTDRQITEKAITETTLIIDGLSGWVGQYSEEISKTKSNFASGGICSKLNFIMKILPQDISNSNYVLYYLKE